QDMSLTSASSLIKKASPTGGGWRGLLHASTQTDNRTPEKVAWLRSLGFSRVVLARELSLEEIREIHRRVPDVELEVFVHGALCVSYSGQCYMSQFCLGRSANRGECAQMCRMKYDLLDADGREIEHQRHLLSLKDMCRIDALEELADAGAVSFKIEGRLKDVAYVKNVVAAYSQRLDDIIRRRPDDFQRDSRGRVAYAFKPDLRKTFNRGLTDYFLHAYRDENGILQGRQRDIASFDTPKALGEYVGKVKEVCRDSFTVAGTAAFANGDGLCFFNSQKELVGFRVNRAEGNRLFPLRMPEALRPGVGLYRNNDIVFERLMSGKTAERKIPVRMVFDASPDGMSLQVFDAADEALLATAAMDVELQLAQKPQRENIIRQLTKLGNTPYVCEELTIAGDADKYFIPSSQLAELRRKMQSPVAPGLSPSPSPVERVAFEGSGGQPHLLNVSNRLAREFYKEQGIETADALEVSPVLNGGSGLLLMQCRHCLRYTLGYCVKHGGRKPAWREPLFLRLGDGREFRLEFDCRACQMNIYSK
ncbi:MAG: U32 family peptidase, partial [Prevotella sp.]|nr:U32 family peptidase [Prevotella sp.]